MTRRPRHGVALLAILGATAAACGSSTGGSGGGGGAGAQATGTGCHGDAAAWATLTAGPFSCATNADCCVVVNGCISESQIVAAADEAAAKAAWPYCDSQCNLCIPPAIQVFCDNGTCAGTEVDLADAGPDLMQDHCGVDAPATTPAGKLHFACGG